jgi:glucokinase
MVDSSEQPVKRVGIEISNAGCTAVAVDSVGGVADVRRAALAADVPTGQQLIGLIKDIREAFGGFERVGIAVPGVVDRSANRVTHSFQMPQQSEADLAIEINEATGLTAIIENDANAAAYGEFRVGAGHGSRNIFYATLGDGVGGAFIFNGRIWHGAGGTAGEFGYLPINSEGTRLEEVASTQSIIRRTRSRFHQDSTSSLSRLSEEQITIAEIIAAADNEDGFAQMMLERTGLYVGAALATVINLLNIDKIIVGGEIIQTRQLVLDAIVDRARKFSFKQAFDSTSIVEGELGQNAAAIGMALLTTEGRLSSERLIK